MTRLSALFAFIMAMPTLAFADICNDINDIANGWNEVANLVEEYGTDEPLTRNEEHELMSLLAALRDGTEALVYLLHNEGDSLEVRMGDDLADGMDGVYDAVFDEELVDSMDDVVDALDDVVDYCDSY
jgi:hypothetical protein